MITSLSNPRMKRIIQLQKKARARREEGRFVVEGLKMVMEAPKDRLAEIYVSRSFMENHPSYKAPEGCPWEQVDDKVFKGLSDTQTPQGILAIVRQTRWDWTRVLHKPSPLLLFLESLQDPGNMGTILRTGEGAGVDGILMNRTCADLYQPKVVRSTMGSIYRVPTAVVDHPEEAAALMREKGIRVYAAHLSGTCSYYEKDYRGGCCFLIGNEAAGLSDSLAEMATDRVKIPMKGKVESLNAGVAASLLMYEARRQRETEAIEHV